MGLGTTIKSSTSALRGSGLSSATKIASKKAAQNFKDTGIKEAAKAMGVNAVKQAGIGGAVGAGVNFVRGEDVWEGAGTGMKYGAISGAATKGIKIGTGAKAGQSLFESTRAFSNDTGVSSSVRTLARLGKDMEKFPKRR